MCSTFSWDNSWRQLKREKGKVWINKTMFTRRNGYYYADCCNVCLCKRVGTQKFNKRWICLNSFKFFFSFLVRMMSSFFSHLFFVSSSYYRHKDTKHTILLFFCTKNNIIIFLLKHIRYDCDCQGWLVLLLDYWRIMKL